MLLFGVITYSTILAAYSGVQQLVAEGARATLSGMSSTERDQLARSFIASNVASYPFLDPTKISISTASTVGTAPTFQVTVNYDMSASFAYGLYGLLPLPARVITRTAVVQLGGF